jgi:hypothetical protein
MPATAPWYVGAVVPLPFTNTDMTGAPQNATTVVVTVTQPDGTIQTPTVTHGGTGVYTAAFTTTLVGHHTVSWVATDATYPGAFTDTFEVQSNLDPTIVSLAEAKDILHLTGTTAFDAKIQGYNGAITNWIEYVCGPVVVQTVTERLPSTGVMQALSKPPVISLVAWTVAPPGLGGSGIVVPSPPSPMFPTMFFGIPYPLTQLYVDPRTGIVTHTSGLPFIYGSYLWQYQAGRLVIPFGIYEAAKIALKHLFMVERGGGAVEAGDSETVATGFGFAVPNRAVELLTPYSGPSRLVAA